MLEKEIRSLDREHRRMRFMWPFLVIRLHRLSDDRRLLTDPTNKLWVGILACFWFIFGAVVWSVTSSTAITSSICAN